MRCFVCQAPKADDAQYCNGCGTPFYQGCSSCGQRNELGARFCVECGGSLKNVASKEGKVPSTNFVKPSAFQGERKLVTIVFADIVDSTKLIENLDPDEAAAQLHSILRTMRDGVRRFGGSVN